MKVTRGGPIRICIPCKGAGCDWKVARTSKTGLCADCNGKEYAKRRRVEKEVAFNHKQVYKRIRSTAAEEKTMRGHFQYENPEMDMTAEVEWEREGDTFFLSTVTFRNGQVFQSNTVKSKDFNTISDRLNNTVSKLFKNGFLPVEKY